MAEDIRNMNSTAGIGSFEVKYKAPDCVLLDSAYCSMGRMIGLKACEKAGYTYYDAVILLELVPEFGVDKDDVDRFEQKLRQEAVDVLAIQNDPEYVHISAAFEKAVRIALEKGKCLIHDRAAAEAVRALGYRTTYVFTSAENDAYKIERAKASPLYRNETDDDVILAKVKEENNIRYNWHLLHSDTEWGNARTYDLCINTDQFGLDYAAELLACAMKGN